MEMIVNEDLLMVYENIMNNDQGQEIKMEYDFVGFE